MGKIRKFCSNSDHFRWCRTKKSDVIDSKIPPYRYLQAFRKLAVERGDKAHKVVRVCTKCIELAPLKRDLTRFLQNERKRNFPQQQSMDEEPKIDEEESKNMEEKNAAPVHGYEDEGDEETMEVEDDMLEIDSERTETLSCPSQKLWLSSQESDYNDEKIKENNSKKHDEKSETSGKKNTEGNPQKIDKNSENSEKKKIGKKPKKFDENSENSGKKNKEKTQKNCNEESQMDENKKTEKNSKKNYEEVGEVVLDEDDNVVINRLVFESLIERAKNHCNLHDEISKVRERCKERFGKGGNPISEPAEFRELCEEAGATKIFNVVMDVMTTDRQSEKRKLLNERRTVSIIYTLMYGQSQQANWFQIATARTLKGLGISSRGVETLRNMGLAAHPNTVLSATKKVSSEHLETVHQFFKDAVDNEYMITVFIDDYHNIHSHHRPSTSTQTQVCHMATLLLKKFPTVPAIKPHHFADQDIAPANVTLLEPLLKENAPLLSKTYVDVMPDWLQAKFFDPESQRNRLLIHDYQKQEIQELQTMRSMEDCKLADCIKLPLKSVDSFRSAIEFLLENGLSIYINKFLVPLIGDWPCQFFVRQVVYDQGIYNLIPFIGPLHISLNARENVVLKFHPFFMDLYAFVFGSKRVLAKKPQPWRISLLLEVLYGGWLLVRDAILSAFAGSKDVQFLTLLNLLDIYVPLTLSIYSVIFKANKADLFYDSMFRCWIMFMMFRRRHYDKALLIALSNMEYWKSIEHPLANVICQSLNAFDEYPVENFHSVLRANTRITDNEEMIKQAAREIDARKHELHNFQSSFVPPCKTNFSSKSVNILKLKSAEFLIHKFEQIIESPNQAKLVRVPKPDQRITKWILPTVFGKDTTVTNDVLPLGFLSHKYAPDPLRKCDMKEECKSKESPMWRVFRGCGHSYHTVCLIPNISSCPKCLHVVSIEMKTLATKATEAVFQLDQSHEFDDEVRGTELEEEDLFEDEQNIVVAESGRVEALIQQIWSWQRPNVPMK